MAGASIAIRVVPLVELNVTKIPLTLGQAQCIINGDDGVQVRAMVEERSNGSSARATQWCESPVQY